MHLARLTTTIAIRDLFINDLAGKARLYRNNGDGTFKNVSGELGIDGPSTGFPCWAFDYDNDGWIDIFATSYDLTLKDVVRGLLGQQHTRHSNRLYRNNQGKGFEDKTAGSRARHGLCDDGVQLRRL